MAKSYLDDNGLLYFWQKIKNLFAPLASPIFTGVPKAPTAASGTNSTQIATTAFVADALEHVNAGVDDVKVDNVSVVTNGVANINTFMKASTSSDGIKGLVPAPYAPYNPGDRFCFLNGLEGWQTLRLETYAGTGPAAGKTVIRLRMDDNGSSAYNGGTSVSLNDATTSASGTMSAADKTKLDSIILSNGVIDSSCLPSFVDDVIEAYARNRQTALSQNWLSTTGPTGEALTPETGKIYVLMNDCPSFAANSQFRWGGTAYVKLSDGGVSEITNAEIDTIVAS